MGMVAPLVVLIFMQQGQPNLDQVPHSEINCWTGERVWTSPEDVSSNSVSWRTGDVEQPYSITHNRDLIVDVSGVVQDYNYISYWFGDPDDPIQARYYLGEREVNVIVPMPDVERPTLNDAQNSLPAEVLCYLQRRFEQVDVLVDSGYVELWSRARHD
jgi:hypothetical protein